MAYTSSVSYLTIGNYTGGFGARYLDGWNISGGSGSGGGSSLPASQQQFPTSAYGQTIPVIWGKARVPGGYIWAPDIIVKTTTTGAVLQTTTVKVLLSARIRFAAPLVPDSRWKLRRLWQDGTLIVDNTRGYKKSGFTYRFYDGHSTQGRDAHMVSKEGAAANVSAHRGYLDIVIQNYDLGVAAVAPPSFEAELVQDDTSSIEVDEFTGFFANTVNTSPAVDWDAGVWYGISTGAELLRRFDIGALQEFYAVPVTGFLGGNLDENSLRYLPQMDRLIGAEFVSGVSGGCFPCIINPDTGAILDHGESMGPAGDFNNTLCALTFSQTIGALITVSTSTGRVATYTFTPDTISRTFRSGADWDGRTGMVECIAIGTKRADDADVYLVGDTKLFKAQITSTGFLVNVSELYTDADNLVYCFYHDDGLIVWNDNNEIMRVNVTSGAVEWTETTPYQIGTSGLTRRPGTPDQHRIVDTFYIEDTTVHYFTDLETGETTSTAKTSSTVGYYAYDGEGGVSVKSDITGVVARRNAFELAGDGATRDLEDLIAAVWERTGFSASEHVEANIDDEIQGAVIDITSGGREVIRSIAEPYSFAIWERDGAIRTKRALTDGGFAVDATISSTDIADAGGQAIRAKRFNPEEFVARYGINYRDPDEVYQARPQWGEIPSLPLPVAPTDIGVKANVPIIMDGDTIKVLATKKVNRLAVEKHEFEFRLKAKYADLEPEDIIRFTFASRTITARVVETTLNPDFTISVKCTEFLSSVDVSISGGTGRPVEPEDVGTALSKYYHLDIPLLNDTDDTAGDSLVQYHVLASSGQLSWDGATLFRKDGSTYLPQASQAEDGLVLIALEVLPDVDIPYVTEFTRTLEVARVSGDADLLASITYQAMCEGGNMFAIGQPGRWEICHVQTITDNGDNTYTFETLRRGIGSSEEYTGDHAVGDLIVWLGEDNVQKLEYAIAALDEAYDFKPVGFGGSLSTTIAVNRTITGEAEKIPKPCQLDAVIDGSDIDLSWVRRSRIGSYWADDGEDTYTTPLGESLEQYVIRIKDGPGGTVLRTVTVDDATAYTYTAANITTDFGSMPSELTYDIRQVSGTGVVCPTRETTITL